MVVTWWVRTTVYFRWVISNSLMDLQNIWLCNIKLSCFAFNSKKKKKLTWTVLRITTTTVEVMLYVVTVCCFLQKNIANGFFLFCSFQVCFITPGTLHYFPFTRSHVSSYSDDLHTGRHLPVASNSGFSYCIHMHSSVWQLHSPIADGLESCLLSKFTCRGDHQTIGYSLFASCFSVDLSRHS